MASTIPKRTEERRRRNKPTIPVTKAPSPREPVWPAPGDHWHEIARDLYLSLRESGQARFYEQSDVQFAFFAGEMTNRCLGGQGTVNGRLNGQVLATVIDMWGNLMTTEADRRRLRVELEREASPVPASVVILDKYRKAVAGK